MIRKNAHPCYGKGADDRSLEKVFSQPALDIRVGENIHRCPQLKRRKSLSANTDCLSLINKRNSVLLDSMSNRCGLSVVKGVDSRADDQMLEMGQPCI